MQKMEPNNLFTWGILQQKHQGFKWWMGGEEELIYYLLQESKYSLICFYSLTFYKIFTPHLSSWLIREPMRWQDQSFNSYLAQGLTGCFQFSVLANLPHRIVVIMEERKSKARHPVQFGGKQDKKLMVWMLLIISTNKVENFNQFPSSIKMILHRSSISGRLLGCWGWDLESCFLLIEILLFPAIFSGAEATG